MRLRRRAREASPAQLAAAGAYGAGYDPSDGDLHYRPAGTSRREVPPVTLERARAYSVAAYRINPMARAVIDTYTSFVVGDTGVHVHCTDPAVQVVVDRFWHDPRNSMDELQDPLLRDHMLNGETLLEPMVGQSTGLVRFSLIDPSRIQGVLLEHGNPLWPGAARVDVGAGVTEDLPVISVDDMTGLREGRVMLWRSWRALLTDTRGYPFLAPIIDQLDAFDDVLSNLVDRTALARFLAMHVSIKGEQSDVDAWVARRGGTHLPKSGTIEATNDLIEFKSLSPQTGSYEDTNTNKALLTNVAAGAGLSRHWLADPEDANRATAGSMAEPVRRRVNGVQRIYLGYVRELVRYAVDRSVAVGRLPAFVTNEQGVEIPTAECVKVVGPEIAAADAQVTAQVLVNLANGLQTLIVAGVLDVPSAQVAARKAVEQFVGHDMPPGAMPDPASPEKANPDATAEAIDDAARAGNARLHII